MKGWILGVLLASCAGRRSILAVPLSPASPNYPENAHVFFVVPDGYQVSMRVVGHHDVDYVISEGKNSTSSVVLSFGLRRHRDFPTGDLSPGRILGADVVWRSFRGGPLYRDGPWVQLAELETILENRTCISEVAGIRLRVVTTDPGRLPELRRIAESMSLSDATPCR